MNKALNYLAIAALYGSKLPDQEVAGIEKEFGRVIDMIRKAKGEIDTEIETRIRDLYVDINANYQSFRNNSPESLGWRKQQMEAMANVIDLLNLKKGSAHYPYDNQKGKSLFDGLHRLAEISSLAAKQIEQIAGILPYDEGKKIHEASHALDGLQENVSSNILFKIADLITPKDGKEIWILYCSLLQEVQAVVQNTKELREAEDEVATLPYLIDGHRKQLPPRKWDQALSRSDQIYQRMEEVWSEIQEISTATDGILKSLKGRDLTEKVNQIVLEAQEQKQKPSAVGLKKLIGKIDTLIEEIKRRVA